MCIAQSANGSTENSQCVRISKKARYQFKAVAENRRNVAAATKNFCKKTNYKPKFPTFRIATPTALKFPIQTKSRKELMFQDKTMTVPWNNMARKELKIFLLEAHVLSSVNTLNSFITFNNCNLLFCHKSLIGFREASIK